MDVWRERDKKETFGKGWRLASPHLFRSLRSDWLSPRRHFRLRLYMPKPVTRWRGLPTPERRLFPSPPVAQQTPHVQHVNIFPFCRVFFIFLSVEFLHSQWPRLFFSPFFFIDSNFFLLGHKLTLYILFVYRERKKKVTSLNGFSSFFFLFFFGAFTPVWIYVSVFCVCECCLREDQSRWCGYFQKWCPVCVLSKTYYFGGIFQNRRPGECVSVCIRGKKKKGSGIGFFPV